MTIIIIIIIIYQIKVLNDSELIFVVFVSSVRGVATNISGSKLQQLLDSQNVCHLLELMSACFTAEARVAFADTYIVY